MNKCNFLFVFISGLLFALILPSLKESVETLTDSIKDLDLIARSGIGIISFDNVQLMDDGYLTMTRLNTFADDTALTRKDSTTEIEKSDDLSEAENCLRAGQRLLEAGSHNKARRLLERAVSLAPAMPQALLALGEFVEVHRSNVVRADQLYLRALSLAPDNARAIRNRVRTKGLVATRDQAVLESIESKRAQLSHVPAGSPALKRIQREAYYHHIHHTVAIEGNTMTLDEIRFILDTGRSVAGKSIVEHTEVVGVDSALRFINSSLLHRVGDITVHDLLNIHLRVLGHTDPPVAGHLRTSQVFVGGHVPPPPDRLPHLMLQFVDWLNSAATAALHPIRYAALAHYHLVFIHPFIDGNGRTARLLMNFLLMQAGYPPIIIRHQDRLQYYDTLQAANEGDTRPFVRFISHCTEKTLDVYLWATHDATPAIDNTIASSSSSSSDQQLLGRRPHNNIDNDNIFTIKAEPSRSPMPYSDALISADDIDGDNYVSSEEWRAVRRDAVLFSGEASVHRWLTGEESKSFTRTSRYYNRLYSESRYVNNSFRGRLKKIIKQPIDENNKENIDAKL